MLGQGHLSLGRSLSVASQLQVLVDAVFSNYLVGIFKSAYGIWTPFPKIIIGDWTWKFLTQLWQISASVYFDNRLHYSDPWYINTHCQIFSWLHWTHKGLPGWWSDSTISIKHWRSDFKYNFWKAVLWSFSDIVVDIEKTQSIHTDIYIYT